MEKINPQIKITELDDSVKQKTLGSEISLAPQPKTTTPDNNTPNCTSAGTNDIISNMRTRILEIENALVKLGLINSRDI